MGWGAPRGLGFRGRYRKFGNVGGHLARGQQPLLAHSCHDPPNQPVVTAYGISRFAYALAKNQMEYAT